MLSHDLARQLGHTLGRSLKHLDATVFALAACARSVLATLSVVALLGVSVEGCSTWSEQRKEKEELERLEQLLWRELGGGQFTSALNKIELAEITGSMTPEQAERARTRIKDAEAVVRAKVKTMAQNLLEKKRERESRRE